MTTDCFKGLLIFESTAKIFVGRDGIKWSWFHGVKKLNWEYYGLKILKQRGKSNKALEWKNSDHSAVWSELHIINLTDYFCAISNLFLFNLCAPINLTFPPKKTLSFKKLIIKIASNIYWVCTLCEAQFYALYISSFSPHSDPMN